MRIKQAEAVLMLDILQDHVFDQRGLPTTRLTQQKQVKQAVIPIDTEPLAGGATDGFAKCRHWLNERILHPLIFDILANDPRDHQLGLVPTRAYNLDENWVWILMFQK